MTDAEIRALARETLSITLVPLNGEDFVGANHKTTISGVEEFGRRLIAIGRAEAFREVLELSNNRVLNDWLRRSVSDDEGRAKS